MSELVNYSAQNLGSEYVEAERANISGLKGSIHAQSSGSLNLGITSLSIIAVSWRKQGKSQRMARKYYRGGEMAKNQHKDQWGQKYSSETQSILIKGSQM